MKHIRLHAMLILAILLAAGCVEEIERGDNMAPRVWFERSPAEGAVIFGNATEFEWRASDWDDDLGMGATYVRLDTVLAGEGTWERVYDSVHEILDLPDSSFNFRVRVVDPRDADAQLLGPVQKCHGGLLPCKGSIPVIGFRMVSAGSAADFSRGAGGRRRTRSPSGSCRRRA